MHKIQTNKDTIYQNFGLFLQDMIIPILSSLNTNDLASSFNCTQHDLMLYQYAILPKIKRGDYSGLSISKQTVKMLYSKMLSFPNFKQRISIPSKLNHLSWDQHLNSCQDNESKIAQIHNNWNNNSTLKQHMLYHVKMDDDLFDDYTISLDCIYPFQSQTLKQFVPFTREHLGYTIGAAVYSIKSEPQYMLYKKHDNNNKNAMDEDDDDNNDIFPIIRLKKWGQPSLCSVHFPRRETRLAMDIIPHTLANSSMPKIELQLNSSLTISQINKDIANSIDELELSDSITGTNHEDSQKLQIDLNICYIGKEVIITDDPSPSLNNVNQQQQQCQSTHIHQYDNSDNIDVTSAICNTCGVPFIVENSMIMIRDPQNIQLGDCIKFLYNENIYYGQITEQENLSKKCKVEIFNPSPQWMDSLYKVDFSEIPYLKIDYRQALAFSSSKTKQYIYKSVQQHPQQITTENINHNNNHHNDNMMRIIYIHAGSKIASTLKNDEYHLELFSNELKLKFKFRNFHVIYPYI